MAAGKLEVEIVARLDKLEKGLKSAEERVKKTGKTMDKALDTPTGKLAVNMGKVFAVMGAAEGAVKGLGGAMHAVSGLGKLMEGDAEGFHESMAASAELLKTMPFGIGALIAGFEQVASSLMGITELQERLAKLQAEQARTVNNRLQTQGMKDATKQLEMQYEILIETDAQNKANLQTELETEAVRAKSHAAMMKIKAATEAARAAGSEMGELHSLRQQADAVRDRHKVEMMLVNARKQEREHAIMLKEQAEAQAALDKERLEREKIIADQKKKAAQEEKKALEEQVRLEEGRMGAISSRLGMVQTENQSKSGFTNQGQTAFGSFTFGEQNVDEKIRQLQEEANITQKSIDQKTSAIEKLLTVLNQKIGFA